LTAPVVIKVPVAAEPENVTETVFNAIGPALFAPKESVASWSDVVLPRPDVAPSGVAAKVNVLRKIVCWLPFALEMFTEAARFEVAPNATTVCVDVLFDASEVVVTSKVDVVLSVAPDDAYEAASPLRVNETEFA